MTSSQNASALDTPYYRSVIRHLEGELLIETEPERADLLLRESQKTFRDLGLRYLEAHFLMDLGASQHRFNKNKEARKYWLEAKGIYQEIVLPVLVGLINARLTGQDTSLAC